MIIVEQLSYALKWKTETVFSFLQRAILCCMCIN